MDFFAAIKEGRVGEVERLLRMTPGLIHAKENGLSPVLMAIYHGHPELADLLAEKTVHLTIFEAAAIGRKSLIVRLLAHDPGLVNAYAEDGFQPLGLACYFGNMECAQYLIAAGARVNSPSRNQANVTPLHSAAARSRSDLVKLLLKHGADPNARQQGDFTPLHSAAQNGDLDSIRALIFEGADVNAQAANGKTPTDLALESGRSEAVRLFKEGITKKLRSR